MDAEWHDRFDDKWMPEPMSGCWLWLQAANVRYGSFYHEGRNRLAHRMSYERFVGPIPDGMQLDHLCRTTQCVNPDHLEPVTAHENTMRSSGPPAINAKKTHCRQGHALSGDNLYVCSRGKRGCKICRHDCVRRWRARISVSQ